MKGLLLMALLVAVPSVEAVEASQSHKLSWTMATTREDKTPLKASEITGVDVRYGSLPLATKGKYIGTATAPLLTYEVPVTGTGKHCY
jgi:hypothetical protein